MNPKAASIDPIEACRRAVEDARSVISAVRPEDMRKPTPCTEWDVRALVAHMAGVCQRFTTMLRGDTIEDPSTRGAAIYEGDDPIAAYAGVADAVLREWEAPGALDKTLQLPFGPTPAALGIRIFTTDQAVHAWDLAQAIGRPHQIDAELAAQVFETMQGLRPELRGPGRAYGELVPVPEEASIQDHMLAISGRRP